MVSLSGSYSEATVSCYQYLINLKNMLWSIIAILLVLWILGFSFSVGGGLIHILLVIALVVFIIRLL